MIYSVISMNWRNPASGTDFRSPEKTGNHLLWERLLINYLGGVKCELFSDIIEKRLLGQGQAESVVPLALGDWLVSPCPLFSQLFTGWDWPGRTRRFIRLHPRIAFAIR